MAKSDHPAAKAGRFVRVFSQTLQGELEKKAAATRAAEAARPAPAAPPPPPPPVPTSDLRGKVVFGIFVLSLVSAVVMILHAELVVSGDTKRILRLVVATPIFLEGILLVTNWQYANDRLGQRLLNRVWGPRGAVTKREKAFARLVHEGLTLLGIAFLAAGIFECLMAIVNDSSTV